MNNKFDELAKGLAQSVTRRRALKQFGVGLAGMALACFGLANRAEAKNTPTCVGLGAFCEPGVPGLTCCKGLSCQFSPGGPFGVCVKK